MRTEGSQRPTLKLVGGGKASSGSASDSYGLTSPALTTSHRTQSQALSESLNCLDSEIETLERRYLEACSTLNIVMSDLVRLGLLGVSEQVKTAEVDGTEEEEC